MRLKRGDAKEESSGRSPAFEASRLCVSIISGLRFQVSPIDPSRRLANLRASPGATGGDFMPRFLPSFLTLLAAAVCFGMMVHVFKQLADEPETDFAGPGEFTFTAPAADHFTLWHKATASIDGIYTVREKRLPAGTEITITHAGVMVPAKVDGSNYISGEEHGDKFSVLTFKAPEPGDYVINVSGLTDKHAFSITRGQGMREILRLFGWGGATMITGGLFALCLILALMKVFPKPAIPPQVH